MECERSGNGSTSRDVITLNNFVNTRDLTNLQKMNNVGCLNRYKSFNFKVKKSAILTIKSNDLKNVTYERVSINL